MIHRSIGNTPEKALLPENWDDVMEHIRKHMRDFKKRDAPKFIVG